MHKQLRHAGACWLAAALLVGCSTKPIEPRQVYPPLLQEMGVEGCVVLAYGIDNDGLVRVPQVLYEKPDDSFEEAAELTVSQRLYDPGEYGKQFREALVWKLPPKKKLDAAAQAAEDARRPPGCDRAALDAFHLVLPKPYVPPKR